MRKTTEAGLLALFLGIGCSGSGDGDAAGGGGVSGSGGSAAQGGGPAGGGAAATSCEAAEAFSGPQLRDCDLPGACGRCLWEKACDQFLFQCAHDADCVCMAECIGNLGVGANDSCLGQCGLTASPPGFSQFVKLAADMCWDEGCGVLGEPPPDSSGPTSTGSLGAGTDADCVFDPGLAYDPCGSVLQLKSTDGSICVRIERRNDGPGTDANTAWTLLDVRVGPLGEVCHTDDPSNLCWFSSHHNYADWAHVSCGNRHYDVDIGNNCGEKDPNLTPAVRLLVFESAPPGDGCAPTADGTCPVGAPIDLVPAP